MNLIFKHKVVKIELIKSFRKKLFGLTKYKEYDGAVLFYNINAIHTFGMKMDIDIVYLDRDYNILGYLTNITPNKILMPVKGVKHIIELDSNLIENKNDYLSINIKK